MSETDEAAFPASRCVECSALYGHSVYACRECSSESIEPSPIDGVGTVYARTTVRVPGADHQGAEPFEVAVVDVGDEETVRVTARITGNPKLEPGDPVVFLERREGTFYFEAV
jgi:uncharacterized OB-fold protein